MAKLYKTDGTIYTVNPSNGSDFTLEELQEMVGGYIEILNLHNDNIIVVNEEGKLERLPLNEAATKIIRLSGYADYIVGNALICTSEEVK